MGDDVVELTTENWTLKNQIGDYDKWFADSQAKLLKQMDDDKRANLIMPKMQKQMIKQ